MSLLQQVRATVGRALGDLIAHAVRDRRRRTFYDAGGTDPYLSRFYFRGEPVMPDGSWPFDSTGGMKAAAGWHDEKIGLYIHHFHRGDRDRECHSHPWRWALSFVVAGGYREERRVGRHVISRIVPPLSFNWLSGDDYHRVDLLENDAWTIFVAGPKASSWGFWNRDTGKVTPWREFLRQKQEATSCPAT